MVLENLHQLSILLLVICSFFYWRHLKNIKRERKLSAFEYIMYIMTQVAYVVWAATFLLLMLGT
nr:hypothetical protein [Virgibacillus sp. NKC19-3]